MKLTGAAKDLMRRIKEPSPSKHRTRCKGGVKWTGKMAALWWAIHVSRARRLRAGDLSPLQLRKIQKQRRECAASATT